MTPTVLYVDPRGPYPLLVADWYDEARDARTYAGAAPVVAHPPCGPWSTMRHLSRELTAECAPHALGVVRRCGGVLEHPARSSFFRAHALPYPGELPDGWGGYTIEVSQCDWGHPARKRTWLYIVGVTPELLPPFPAPREPTLGKRRPYALEQAGVAGSAGDKGLLGSAAAPHAH